MMIEIFKYTERVINMVRPRKLLFMAIGEFTLHISTFGVGNSLPYETVLPPAQR